MSGIMVVILLFIRARETFQLRQCDRDTGVTKRIDQIESLRINGMVHRDSSMRNYPKIKEKVGRPPNHAVLTDLQKFL